MELNEFRKNIRKKLGRVVLHEGDTESHIEWLVAYLTRDVELSKKYLDSCTPNEILALYPVIGKINHENTKESFVKILKNRDNYYGTKIYYNYK